MTRVDYPFTCGLCGEPLRKQRMVTVDGNPAEPIYMHRGVSDSGYVADYQWCQHLRSIQGDPELPQVEIFD